MTRKQRATLGSILDAAPEINVGWTDVVKILKGLGANVNTGGGRLRIEANGTRAVLHSPDPKGFSNRSSLLAVRRFLLESGINTNEI